MSPRRIPVAFLCLVWVGIIVGISFIEAPVKFRTPTLTRPVALDVGRTVFHASQLVQAALLALALAAGALGRAPRWVWLLLGGVAAALALQMAWLFPVLDARAEAIIAGRTPGGSPAHALYGALEVLKVLGLAAAAVLSLLQYDAEHDRGAHPHRAPDPARDPGR
ncbi:MAG TPA: DUF4149 domain-containing protein [Myxococcaceae bacterium]|nr:DUF4149 domain-containing protein [Myxococcaceae bacterium]